MLLRHGRTNPRRVLALGLAALALANVGSFVIGRAGAPESIADPLRGALHGAAIALALLGVYLVGRARRERAAPPR